MVSEPSRRERARELRRTQTEAEALLWSVLRSKQLCGLKFRRQHPVGPYFADFACMEHRVVVELDGDCHDYVEEDGLKRQRWLEANSWRVIRFPNDDVLKDVEAVAMSLAQQLGLPYSFQQRSGKLSGMLRKTRQTRPDR